MKKFILPVSFLIFLLIIICSIIICFPSLKGDIYVKDYGIFLDDANYAEKNSKIINKLIRKAKKNSKIILPKGKIYISDGILFFKKSKITIEGNNTKIINTLFSPYTGDNLTNYSNSNILKLLKSNDIIITGINLDYLNCVNVSGKIIDFKNGYTIFKPFDGTPLKGGENVASVTVFDSNENTTGEKYFDSLIKLEEENKNDNLFKISGFYGQDGDDICIRFSTGTFSSPAIFVSETKNLTLKNMNIISCPSATVYAPCENENIFLENFNIVSDNEKRLFASNEDGIHIKGLRGNFILKNSNFVGMGDDIVNIHSKAAKIVNITENKITATIGNENTKIDNLWAKKGDLIEFYNEKLEKITSATALKIRNGTIIFDNLPKSISGAYVMQNSAHCPDVTIDNIKVKRGRARGLLLQTKNAMVTNSSFKNLCLSAILIAPDITKWFEMGPSENIIIKNNRFINTASSKTYGVISVNDKHDASNSNLSSKIHGSITIFENVFENSLAPAVIAARYEKINVTDNIFINSDDTVTLSKK